jgi:HD-GYP domain-containing protein (c-di-GMP phosphodiesterase class II)
MQVPSVPSSAPPSPERWTSSRPPPRGDPPSNGAWLDLALDHSGDGIERILGQIREHLDMQVAVVSEVRQGALIYRHVDGDGASFGIQAGTGVPLESTYCGRMLEGSLPHVVQDATKDPRVSDLDFTHKAEVGAYLGVPLEFSGGRLYGALCCLSHTPHSLLDDRDAKTARLLGRLIVDHLERQELESHNWRLRMEVVGVRALLAALEARDGYTGTHSEAVVDLSRAVAKQLDLNDDQVLEIQQVALLHDIGKIGVPDSTLRKPGPLDDQEWDKMRRHPLIGARIVSSVQSLRHLAPAIRAEHERWDGTGYPDGLAREEIPLASRIVFVCDAYDAIVSDRPYRSGRLPEAGIEELKLNSGGQFCPEAAQSLVDVLITNRVTGVGSVPRVQPARRAGGPRRIDLTEERLHAGEKPT